VGVWRLCYFECEGGVWARLSESGCVVCQPVRVSVCRLSACLSVFLCLCPVSVLVCECVCGGDSVCLRVRSVCVSVCLSVCQCVCLACAQVLVFAFGALHLAGRVVCVCVCCPSARLPICLPAYTYGARARSCVWTCAWRVCVRVGVSVWCARPYLMSSLCMHFLLFSRMCVSVSRQRLILSMSVCV